MTLLQSIILGILQGLTEFLPISSSAHLVIVPALFKWPEHPIFLDVSLHFGTLLALIVYFRKDLQRIFTSEKRTLSLIVIATLPAAISGYFFNDFFEKTFSDTVRAAFFLFITAFLLFFAEVIRRKSYSLLSLSWWQALIIGLFQAFALFPGISRSGSTISGGMFLGLRREEATRFAFLLGIPVIMGAFFLELPYSVVNRKALTPFVLGGATSFFSGYLAIHFLLKYVKKGKLYPFAVYCLIFGLFSLWVVK
jgi:undecaprenyl-diphosphatase